MGLIFYWISCNRAIYSVFDTIWINLLPSLVPSHPRNVTLKPLSATTIQVNWSRPAHENGKIIYYRVYYRKAIEDEENFQNVSGDVYYYDIHFLNPFTNYTIEVQGYTSAGGGNRSLPKVSRTFESGRRSVTLRSFFVLLFFIIFVFLFLFFFTF